MAPTQTPKGGQKAPSPLDRIDTPDGLNVDAVMAAAAKVEREKAVTAAKKRLHMSDCASHRNSECNCPCNLAQLPPPLEAMKVGSTEWIRVDEEHIVKVRKPHPTTRGEFYIADVLVQPRWICTTCGMAQRVPRPGGHACDESYLSWKARPLPLASLVTGEQLRAGAYRISIWRDSDLRYHLEELLVVDGKVVETRERAVDMDYSIVEAAMSDLVVEEFSP